MKTAPTLKKLDNCVFYSVCGKLNIGSAMINRGIFDKLSDAKQEAKKYFSAQISRHEDKDGQRIQNKVILCFVNGRRIKG